MTDATPIEWLAQVAKNEGVGHIFRVYRELREGQWVRSTGKIVAYVKYAELGEVLSMRKDALRKSTNRMVELGWIRKIVKGGRGRPNKVVLGKEVGGEPTYFIDKWAKKRGFSKGASLAPTSESKARQKRGFSAQEKPLSEAPLPPHKLRGAGVPTRARAHARGTNTTRKSIELSSSVRTGLTGRAGRQTQALASPPKKLTKLGGRTSEAGRLTAKGARTLPLHVRVPQARWGVEEAWSHLRAVYARYHGERLASPKSLTKLESFFTEDLQCDMDALLDLGEWLMEHWPVLAIKHRWNGYPSPGFLSGWWNTLMRIRKGDVEAVSGPNRKGKEDSDYTPEWS